MARERFSFDDTIEFDKDELKIIDGVLNDKAKGDTECHILT